MVDKPHCLIATLSTEPQGVTRVLDWLLGEGYPIKEVVVVYTAGEVIRPSLERLRVEFGCGYYRPLLRLREVPVLSGHGAFVSDIRTREEVTAFFQTMHRTVKGAQEWGGQIHLSITNGRKTMAVYSMVVAQLLFRQDDKVWHMMSAERFSEQGKGMHAAEQEPVLMLDVPVLGWGDEVRKAVLLAPNDPWEATLLNKVLYEQEQQRRRDDFLRHRLTRKERELVELLVRTGWGNAELAQRLGKREQTVANQLSQIYRAFDEWRGVAVGGSGSRAALLAELAGHVEER